jgi:AP endonuclease-2
VVAIQEAKLADKKITRELACVPNYESFWAASTAKLGYAGVTTFARSPAWSPVAVAADALPGEAWRDHLPRGAVIPDDHSCSGATGHAGEGRCLETDHGGFVLLSVYAPNARDRAADGGARGAAKAAFLTALRARVDALLVEGRQVVVVGDINICPGPDDVHPGVDRGEMGYSAAEEAALARLLAPPMTDAWRSTHQEVAKHAPRGARGFTCWDERTNARARDEGARIDVVLVSAGLRIVSCEVLTEVPRWSDHAPLRAVLAGAAPPPPHPPLPSSSAVDPRWHGDPRQAKVSDLFRRQAEKEGGVAVSRGVATAPPRPPAPSPPAKKAKRPPGQGGLDAFVKAKKGG